MKHKQNPHPQRSRVGQPRPATEGGPYNVLILVVMVVGVFGGAF